MLTGDIWQKMPSDAKAAFVWRIGNLAEIKRAQNGGGAMDGEGLFPYLVSGLSGKPMGGDRIGAGRAGTGRLMKPAARSEAGITSPADG